MYGLKSEHIFTAPHSILSMLSSRVLARRMLLLPEKQKQKQKKEVANSMNGVSCDFTRRGTKCRT